MRNRRSLRHTAIAGLGAVALLFVSGCVPEDTGSELGTFLKDTLLGAIAAMLL